MAEDGPSPRPLANKKVVVTRARSQAAKFAQGLEDLGAEIIEFPTIEILPVDGPLDVGPLGEFDWVVFTSSNGVIMFERALREERRSLGELREARVCALGPATAEALEEAGIETDFIPEEFVAESLLEKLKAVEPDLVGKKFLAPRGNLARSFLPEELSKLGAVVREIVVYKTEIPDPSEEKAEALLNAAPDVVAFTSSSTARNFAALLGPARLGRLKNTAIFAAIGPVTAATAKELGMPIGIQPNAHDVAGLVDALARWAMESR